MKKQYPSWRVHRGKVAIRVNKMRNRRSKWGPGKVHWVVYDPKWNAYFKACWKPDILLISLGGETSWGNVPKDTQITCKRCLKIKWLNG
ncbi:hypothetical protein GCM10010423_65510 [Streptomyces levis]|uniref:Uncharacterized protein n=1 Tax=Streptomyces levis TaxID=285566 RepID=A0ABN3P145_9ACTN